MSSFPTSFSSGFTRLTQVLFFFCAVFNAFIVQAQQKDIAYYTAQAPFKMPTVVEPTLFTKTFSIKDFGAVSDGQTLNTTAFAKAIEACVKAGGGQVLIPAGLWLTGPIQMQSNVNLHVEKGGLVQFTSDHNQYPIIKASNSSGSYTVASPIYGYSLKNIAITGEGIIDGAGESWRPIKKMKFTNAQWNEQLAKGGVLSKDGSVWWPNKEAMEGEAYLKQLKKDKSKPEAADYIPAREFMRPYMVMFVDCENVLVENITLRNSPKFVFYPSRCTNLTMRGVSVFNEWYAQNGDAIDISACKNVVIYKCTVSAGDDGICMKSSSGSKGEPNAEANLQNILIAGCTVYHAHGGFVIGSNTDGGMKNIYVADCNFIGSDIGIRVKSNIGKGGLVKDIFIKDIFMTNILGAAILFDTYYNDVPVGAAKEEASNKLKDKVPNFSGFHLENIICKGAKTGVQITGLPEMPVNHLYFQNMIIESESGFVSDYASDIELKKVKFITTKSPVYVTNHTLNLKTID